MELYADVIVDINARSLDRIFQYRIPEELLAAVKPGSRVQVPFGKSDRSISGVAVAVGGSASVDASLIKDIISVSGDLPPASAQLISLAGMMRRRFGGTMTQALKTVMPVKKPVRELRSVSYRLSDREKAVQSYEKIKDSKRERARARLLKAMLESADGSISADTAAAVLRVSKQTADALARGGLIEIDSRQIYRTPSQRFRNSWGNVSLNAQQQAIVDDILGSYGRVRSAAAGGCREPDMVHLIHGITGSGKTEVYMALMEKILAQGRQVIVLIPEISLTLQTVSRFYERFGDRIAVMNSRLSAGERYDQYMRAQRGDASIMIGPRSALFTPFADTGLIIIDEEHEAAYKSESVPRYLARDVAIERARMAGALVVLGSATPSLSSYYNAQRGLYTLHTLGSRAREGSSLPDVSIVDLRGEFRRNNRSILSGELHRAMEECLGRGEQMMLFINRRGFAGFVSCRSCGYVFKCSHCDVSMTIHRNGILKCHYCGSEQKLPKICPSCGSPYIAGFGLGTQKVEDIVRKEFPAARVLRMDRDTTSGRDEMGRILQDFSEGSADILIGTQMIVKGHDFGNVTLVGIIAADLSMFSGDYLSSERTFQLLTQAAGRAGRGSRPGHVIIQTYRPDDYCVQCAAAQDYPSFYNKEMEFRKSMHYPPAAHMLMISIESESDEAAAGAGESIRDCLVREAGDQNGILGPSRAGIGRIRDMYRYAIYVKRGDEDELIRLKDAAERYMHENEQAFRKVFVGVDMDPCSLF